MMIADDGHQTDPDQALLQPCAMTERFKRHRLSARMTYNSKQRQTTSYTLDVPNNPAHHVILTYYSGLGPSSCSRVWPCPSTFGTSTPSTFCSHSGVSCLPFLVMPAQWGRQPHIVRCQEGVPNLCRRQVLSAMYLDTHVCVFWPA